VIKRLFRQREFVEISNQEAAKKIPQNIIGDKDEKRGLCGIPLFLVIRKEKQGKEAISFRAAKSEEGRKKKGKLTMERKRQGGKEKARLSRIH